MAGRFITLISKSPFIFAWLLTICFIENGPGNGWMDLGVALCFDQLPNAKLLNISAENFIKSWLLKVWCVLNTECD